MPPRFSIQREDALSWLRALPDSSVDLVITDPPYESLEKHRARGTTTRLKHSKSSSNDWFDVISNAAFPDLFAEIFRVLKPKSHFYLFSDPETMFVAKPAAEAVGFKFWKPLVWDKHRIGMGYHYRCRYEFILFFEKGKRPWRRLHDLSVPDVLEFPRIKNGYPTEKPVDLMAALVKQSADRGAVVADPFCGSGSVGAAAVEHGAQFMGCDTAELAVALTRRRLRAAGGVEVPQEKIARRAPRARKARRSSTRTTRS